MKADQEYIDRRISETAARLTSSFESADPYKIKNHVSRMFHGVIYLCSGISLHKDYPNNNDVDRITRNILIVAPIYHDEILAEVSGRQGIEFYGN